MNFDVGYCELHSRPNEAICKTCECVVCASCVLFGDHKKHDILGLKEGSVYLRDSIHGELKKGTLKKDYTETRLLEIREYHLRLEKYKNDTIKLIEETFKEITNNLKKRKNEIISEALDKFNEEKSKIVVEEEKW
jgi:hypothetical protein